MNGVLVLDKPAGPTSHDVVQTARRLLKVKKAGHTGTLDPLATGVLPICLGDATRVAGFITESTKAYDAVICLGVETDTQDAQGKEIARAPVPPLDERLLETALARFRGSIEQVPPMYSAIKVDGVRLYELARAGRTVDRAARPVTVYSLVLRDFSATELTVSVECSKGFFVRTLAHDLGRALGCGGHLKTLRRTRSGPFTLAQAVPLASLADRSLVEQRLVSVDDALCELPRLVTTEAEAQRVVHGVPIEVGARAAAAPSPDGGRVRVVDPSGMLLAVAEVVQGRLRYCRVLA